MNEGICWGPVSCVFQSHARFQFIEQRFNDEPLPQHDFVQNGQRKVFHVAANASDQVQALLPQTLEKRLRNAAFIAERLAFQLGNHGLKRLAVVGVSRRDLDGHDLTLVVDDQMQLEPEKPPHGASAPLGQSLEDLVPVDPCVVADSELGAVHKTDSGFLTAKALHQDAKRNRQARHQSDKPSAARQVSKAVAMFLLHAIEPEGLEMLEGREMKQHHDEEHFAERELARARALAACADQPMPLPFFKGLCKVVETTEQCDDRGAH